VSVIVTLLLPLLLASVPHLAQETAPPAEDDPLARQKRFALELESVAEVFLETLASNQELLLQGRMDEAHAILLGLVPEPERSAAHEFLLGNWFFSFDPELSTRCHRRAFELAPENPVIIAEWATELHRGAEYSGALERYDDYTARMEAELPGSTPPHVLALRAECLLHLRRYREAVATWRKADPEKNYQAMSGALVRVHSDPHPFRRRDDLLKMIRGGDEERLEELIELDLNWSETPWDFKINDLALERDLALADRLCADDPARRAELELLVDIGRAMLPRILGSSYEGEVFPLSPTILMRRMKSLELWGETAHLPHSSLVASHVFQYAQRRDCLTLDELLVAFGPELRERAWSEEGDEEACNILTAIYLEHGDPEKIVEIQLLAWQHYDDWHSACAILARKGDSLDLDDPDLRAALAQFSLEPEVQRIGLYVARESSDEIRLEALASLLRAELASVVDLSELPDYFRVLEEGVEAVGGL
jgi:hypothetical protein